MNHQVESAKLLKVLRRRKLPEFKNLTEVCYFVTNFVKKKYDLDFDFQINQGYCFIWAYLVWALSKQDVKFVTTDGHVLVFCDDNYYDAEHPFGFFDLESLKISLDEVEEVDVRGMAWYWARCGVAKKEFRSVLRKTFNKLYNKIRAGGFHDNDPYYAEMLCVDDIPC